MKQAAPTLSLARALSVIAVVGGLPMSMAGCDDANPRYARHDEAAAYPGPGYSGAGTTLSGASLAAGQRTISCGDRTPPVPFAPSGHSVSHRTCYYADDPKVPAATVEWIVESAPAADDAVHVRLTLNPAFVDNTYGAESIGWENRGPMPPKDPMGPMGPMGMDPKKPAPPKGDMKAAHTFRDLVGSDHAEFKLRDASGKLVLHFKADYLSESAGAKSGYATLGVSGGDGKMIVGQASDVLAVSTSLDRNLNVCGLSSYTTDSPATDASYTPNPRAPEWDYRVVYDVWVRERAFGDGGFGTATVDFVHASPSKVGSSTVEVVEKPCQPNEPYCEDPRGCECFVADGSCVPRETEDECFIADGTCNDRDTPPPPPPDEECFVADGECNGRDTPPPPPPADDCTGLNCGV